MNAALVPQGSVHVFNLRARGDWGVSIGPLRFGAPYDKENQMKLQITRLITPLLFVGVMLVAATAAQADPVTFSSTGVFSVSGTNVVNFTNGSGTTTITFNGTTDSVNTPAGAQFGDIVVTTTVPANLQGPAIGGNFTLHFFQVSPAGAGR